MHPLCDSFAREKPTSISLIAWPNPTLHRSPGQYNRIRIANSYGVRRSSAAFAAYPAPPKSHPISSSPPRPFLPPTQLNLICFARLIKIN
jgi:hypothetical protein